MKGTKRKGNNAFFTTPMKAENILRSTTLTKQASYLVLSRGRAREWWREGGNLYSQKIKEEDPQTRLRARNVAQSVKHSWNTWRASHKPDVLTRTGATSIPEGEAEG